MRQAGAPAARQRRERPTKRRAALPAAVAALAIGLFGATPAWAAPDVEAPTAPAAPASPAAPAPEAAAPLGLSWRAVDAAGELQAGLVFEVRAPRTAAEAASGQDPVTARVTDFAGQPDYGGADLDSVPGAFTITEFVDLADPARTHAIAAAEPLEIRIAATAAGETPDSAWQTLTAPETTDDAIPVIEAAPAETPAAATPESEIAPDGAAPAADAPAASAEPDAAAQPERAADAPATAAPRALGPDAPGVVAPYVFWTAVDQNDRLLPGATFEIAGPRTSSSGWTRTVTVTDCTSAPCTGIDRDPDPGEFQVKYLTPGTNPTANGVSTASVYRVRQTAAPSGYEVGNTGWSTIPRTGNTGLWGGQTYGFGTFPNTAIPPAKIIVRTGGDRVGTTGLDVLSGVTLLLKTGTESGATADRADGLSGNAPGWARCVSDGNGECTFLVPDTQSGGSNRNMQFWVTQAATGVPTGWFANTALSTEVGSGTNATQYQFRTGAQLRSNGVYRSGSSFMAYGHDIDSAALSNPMASSGVWQQSRNNPAAAQSCGIKVALVLDLSGSVNTNGLPALKTASNRFVEALVGTQSQMALFSFAGTSPAEGAVNYPKLTSVSTQALGQAFQARYANWNATGGTNWDRGIGVVAEAAQAAQAAEGGTEQQPYYDVTVVLTDGNPTFYGPDASGPGSRTRLMEVESGVFAANALKKTGSRVIAFGVGAGVTGTNSALNLRAISGPVKNSDYFQTSSYETAGQELRKLALGSCAGQLTVTKMVVPHTAPQGSIQGAAPADDGWTFTASNPGAGVTLPNPPVRVTEDDGTGTVAFPLTFSPSTQSGEVTVTETQQPGYTLQPVGGQNAVCTNLVTGVKVTPSGNPANGFRVAVPNGQTVNCAVYNRAPDQSATVQVDKVWQLKDPSGASLGSYRLPGDEGRLPAGLQGQLTLSGPGSAGATKQDWGKPRANYVAGGQATIDETVTIDAAKLPGCTLTSNQLTKRGATAVTEALPHQATLTPGANTFEITNTVTCASQLSLLKLVEDGSAAPANWNLTAAPQSGGGQSFTVPGAANRAAKNTFAITADRGYLLSETAQDPAAPLSYLLDRVERCEPKASAPDGCSWVRVDETAPVTVGLGQNAVYRFVNRPAPALEVPLTGGLSSDALGLAGAGLAGLALLVGALTWTRRRTESST